MTDEERESNRSQNILGVAMNKLPPKLIFILFILGLLLLSVVLTVAVYEGSQVDLFGIKISPGSTATAIRLNIRFDPNEVNPRDPKLQVMAYKQTIEGEKILLPARNGVEPGGIYVDLEPPDMETPFFVVIQSSSGTWKTEDISLKNSFPTAYKISN